MYHLLEFIAVLLPVSLRFFLSRGEGLISMRHGRNRIQVQLVRLASQAGETQDLRSATNEAT
jgi:hypothetical protein